MMPDFYAFFEPDDRDVTFERSHIQLEPVAQLFDVIRDPDECAHEQQRFVRTGKNVGYRLCARCGLTSREGLR